MGHTTHLKHVMDDALRKEIDQHAIKIAELLLGRDLWRTHWSVDVDGCTFKIKVEGYPRYGTPRYDKRLREQLEAAVEFEEKQGK